MVPQTNPTGAESGSDRVFRGGSYADIQIASYVISRNHITPSTVQSKLGFRVVRGVYLLQLALPTFQPSSGTYNSAQSVIISSPDGGAQIRYTSDGSEPSESSPLYSGPIDVSVNTTLKAKAYKVGWNASETNTAVYVINSIPINFIQLPGGSIDMGDPPVTVLAPFIISVYETTQADYYAVMGEIPSFFSGNPNRLVEQVSWFDAIEYCNRRSMLDGLTPCYFYDIGEEPSFGTNPDNWPLGWNSTYLNHVYVFCDWSANGFRLPKAAEWRFAAIGANLSQGYHYSGSDNANYVARYNQNSGGHTWDVGSLAPNELGTYDMSGNVWEWCWDVYDGAASDLDDANYRSVSGGSWSNNYSNCSSYQKQKRYASYTDSNIGFRVVRNHP